MKRESVDLRDRVTRCLPVDTVLDVIGAVAGVAAEANRLVLAGPTACCLRQPKQSDDGAASLACSSDRRRGAIPIDDMVADDAATKGLRRANGASIIEGFLQVKAPQTTRAVEHALSELRDRLQDGPVALRLQQRLRGDDLGGQAALMQLIATWARNTPEPILKTFVSADHPDRDVSRFVQEDHGLLAALMASAAVDVAGEPIDTKLRSAAIRRLDQAAMWPAARRGNRLLFACADHTSRAAPQVLYNTAASLDEEPSVRSHDGFAEICEHLLALNQLGANRVPIPVEQKEQLAIVLRQLFLNTHDWARTTPDRRKIAPSVRLLRGEWINGPLAELVRRAEGDDCLQGYLQHASHAGETRSTAKVPDMRRFLEVTLLDTGPGLASRRLHQQSEDLAPDLSREYAAVLDCLRTHMTTSSASHRGTGLHLVQTMLTRLGGYWRIRTGRLALCRDFVRDPYDPQGERPEPRLTDWEDGGTTLSSLAPVTGTLITFVVPTLYGASQREMQ